MVKKTDFQYTIFIGHFKDAKKDSFIKITVGVLLQHFAISHLVHKFTHFK